MKQSIKGMLIVVILSMPLPLFPIGCGEDICGPPCREGSCRIIDNCATIVWKKGVSAERRQEIHSQIDVEVVKPSYYNFEEVHSPSMCYEELRRYYKQFEEVHAADVCSIESAFTPL